MFSFDMNDQLYPFFIGMTEGSVKENPKLDVKL